MNRATAIAFALLPLVGPPTLCAQADREANAINAVIAQYARALNAGNVDSVIAVYAADAVFMPADAQTQSGQQAIREYYRTNTFGDVYHLTFTPAEVITSSDWTFARVDVAGTTRPKSGGPEVRVSSKVIFILHRERNGSWLIARYIFNRNSPPGAP